MKSRGGRGRVQDRSRRSDDECYWLYGRHAVCAALQNSRRTIEQLLVTENAQDDAICDAVERRDLSMRVVGKDEFSSLLGASAVHQGLAVRVRPLEWSPLESFVRDLGERSRSALVVADRVSDPQNIGAILRNVAAFGGDGLLLPGRYAPRVSGAMAKAAAGALETIPIFYCTNLSRSLVLLQKSGFWCYAACEDGEALLSETEPASHSAFVLGSEGEGIRPLLRRHCDMSLRIAMAGGDSYVENLNVASTAAIFLYRHSLGSY